MGQIPGVSKPLSGRSLLQVAAGLMGLLGGLLGLQTAKRSFTFASGGVAYVEPLVSRVSKPLSGRSLLQECGYGCAGVFLGVSKPLSGRSLLQVVHP